MLLDLGDGLRIRPWRRDDLDALLRHANNPKIAGNLRDQFPHPYTRRDGIDYLNYVRAMDVPMSLAVEYEIEAIGGIGFKLGVDIARLSVEMGYWLAEPYWGRGLTTRAVIAAADWAFGNYLRHRLLPQCGIHARAGKGRLRARRASTPQRHQEWLGSGPGDVFQGAVRQFQVSTCDDEWQSSLEDPLFPQIAARHKKGRVVASLVMTILKTLAIRKCHEIRKGATVAPPDQTLARIL